MTTSRTSHNKNTSQYLRIRVLSGHERKFGDVCGEEFSAQARREVLPHGHQSISRQWICKERATPLGPKRTAARRVAPNLAWGFVARRSQPHCGGCSWCPCGSTSRLAPGQIGRNKRHCIY